MSIKSFNGNAIRDFFSECQVDRFYLLLKLPSRPNKKALNIGEHLLYLNRFEGDLSLDGYYEDLTPRALLSTGNCFNFKRRLWAGGSINHYKPLEFNKHYICQENIRYVKEVKGTQYVGIERIIFETSKLNGVTKISDEISLKEMRILAYTNSGTTINEPNSEETIGTTVVGEFTFNLMDIIRYSQLTLNPHRIHWDKEYSKSIEGYNDIIAQGPFIIQILAHNLNKIVNNTTITDLKYKNINPIYPDTSVTILMKQDGNKLRLIMANNSIMFAELIATCNK
ncbi:hypothetical protein Kpol_339p8 [Vanderwaltozyma polyspora DSM 70294]|uniref:MaoC-like domain-containing protein n=1 Tax=Vanderwaltozyma polyspora (strain ATCC 22028 / DSM 70294 / BCRC 21397 / CBS 2163 / NBRC 10782 / NRRL Y-8283 / UCD 57-17) TaxID=436907 RepID=A7TSD6_VANPO|nr:uncharacterized protein Kpol_339p8 [Vanderwaltozyma polyspora DSM 70294]EDO14821.1 hypothetical protein Kpol_339p8 [Vanderwaltozyma polyspora DSM 70294]